MVEWINELTLQRINEWTNKEINTLTNGGINKEWLNKWWGVFQAL